MHELFLTSKLDSPESHWWFKKVKETEGFNKYYTNLFSTYHTLLDKNFLNEVQKNPFSRFYELYIAEQLDLNGFVIESNDGLDFISNSQKVAFECTTIDVIKTDKETIWNGGWVDESKLKSRITNVFSNKAHQIKRFADISNHAIILCISGAQTSYHIEYDLEGDLGTENDLLYQVLYGKKPVLSIQIGKIGNDLSQYKVIDEREFIKPFSNKKQTIDSGIFRQPTWSCLSAVIFTPYDGVRMMEQECLSWLYLNPNASIKLSESIVQKLIKFSKIFGKESLSDYFSLNSTRS